MPTKQHLPSIFKIVFLGLVLGLGVSYVLAQSWTPPSLGPPACSATDLGCYSPINVSDNQQFRDGLLYVDDRVAASLVTVAPASSVLNGTFVPDPTALLDIGGRIRIRGAGTDTPGVGKVLTSDINGLASWGDPSAGALWYATTTAPANSIENNKLGGPFGDVFIAKSLRLYPTDSTGAQGVIKLKDGPSLMHWRGVNNIFVGKSAGNFLVAGSNNSGFGYNSLLSLTTGSKNTALGVATLQNNTTGLSNVAVGNVSQFGSPSALSGNSYNTSVGASSLVLANGSGGPGNSNYNTAVGYESLLGADYDSGASYNVAVGYQSLQVPVSPNFEIKNNVAVGTQSLLNLGFTGSASDNTALGYKALSNLDSGNGNVAIGSNAGSGATGSLDNSIFIGRNAGFNPFPSNNVVTIGYNSGDSGLAGGFFPDYSFVLGGIGPDEPFVRIGVIGAFAPDPPCNPYPACLPSGFLTRRTRLTVQGDTDTNAFEALADSSMPAFAVLKNGNVQVTANNSPVTDKTFVVRDYSPNDNNEKFTIMNRPSTGGSVGIGSTTPYAKLAVKGYFVGAVDPLFPLFEVDDDQGNRLFRVLQGGKMRFGSGAAADSSSTFFSFQGTEPGATGYIFEIKRTGGALVFAVDYGNIVTGNTVTSVWGGLRFMGASTLSCTSDRRGLIWYVPGAAGVVDSLSVCAKDATGNYAWRALY